MAKNIKKRSEDYAQWYLDVIKAAKLADYAPVRGCMVIRPEGYSIWEAIQRQLDRRFKATGHVNAYFPLLIPQSFLTKEAEHVEGFAMECAIVTHTKLERDAASGGLKPAAPLEEPLIIRPTSETVIGHMYAQWVQSYRDLPLLINQWCNVMRWELRTRLFLRTSEFLWQEGHTAHETEKEAHEETLRMLDVYADFAENVLAVPVVKGTKTDAEKFPGAVTTYCIEGLMQDGKSLQMGTSHDLGQNFAKAFEIKFLSRENKQEFAYTTSWGVSTRLIGATIMAHSDDEGLVLPPRVAPIVGAIVPIFRSPEEETKVRGFIDQLVASLIGGELNKFAQHGIDSYLFDPSTEQRLIVDYRDARPGDKQYHWEQRGVPFRMEVGPRDVDAGAFVLKSRIEGGKEPVKLADASRQWFRDKLDAAHQTLIAKAKAHREANTRDASSYDELKTIIKEQGGFVRCFFKPDKSNEAKIKTETKATVRCIPFDQPGTSGKDIFTGEETNVHVLFAQAY
ncbi:MAG: proline--tRNA ligase [Anaerolineae bacterium]|nr:proline--tRNA ligase [Phycisphaerae bacterium]